MAGTFSLSEPTIDPPPLLIHPGCRTSPPTNVQRRQWTSSHRRSTADPLRCPTPTVTSGSEAARGHFWCTKPRVGTAPLCPPVPCGVIHHSSDPPRRCTADELKQVQLQLETQHQLTLQASENLTANGAWLPGSLLGMCALDACCGIMHRRSVCAQQDGAADMRTRSWLSCHSTSRLTGRYRVQIPDGT